MKARRPRRGPRGPRKPPREAKRPKKEAKKRLKSGATSQNLGVGGSLGAMGRGLEEGQAFPKAKIMEKFYTPAPARQGAADLQASPTAADPSELTGWA